MRSRRRQHQHAEDDPPRQQGIIAPSNPAHAVYRVMQSIPLLMPPLMTWMASSALMADAHETCRCPGTVRLTDQETDDTGPGWLASVWQTDSD